MDNKVLKPLTAGRVARRLLAFYANDPKRWAQGAFGYDHLGRRMFSGALDAAKCVCPLGAIQKILPGYGAENRDPILDRRFEEAWNVLDQAFGPDGIAFFNDHCESFDELKKKLHTIARQP